MSTTLARTHDSSGSHWYYIDGRPCYELPKKDGKGMKSTTLADARKLNLLPSVTTILRVLAKPALESWKMEQACLAVMTAPRLPNEELDAFVERVLHTEEQHKQEAAGAADRGAAIHEAIQSAITGGAVSAELDGWITPVILALYGEIELSEFVLTSKEGFAGRVDLIQKLPDNWLITDFKTTKNLPKTNYFENRLQLAAYSKMWQDYLIEINDPLPIKVQNVFISTMEMGQFRICPVDDWVTEYFCGFRPLLEVWQHQNQYRPLNSTVAKNLSSGISNTVFATLPPGSLGEP